MDTTENVMNTGAAAPSPFRRPTPSKPAPSPGSRPAPTARALTVVPPATVAATPSVPAPTVEHQQLWLLAHQERVAQEGARHGWTAEQRALVFPNRVGRIGGYSAFLEHCWQPLLSKAGLRYRKPHSMRHTFATWALEGSEAKAIKPVPIHHVRDWMGHASVEETERYLHPERARYARSVDNLDAYVVD